MRWLAGELTYSTIAGRPCPSLERGKSLGFADGEGDGDKTSDGVSRHQGKPDTLNAHHVAKQVHKRHGADHVAEQTGERGDTHLLNRLEVHRHGHGKIAQGHGQDNDARGVGGNLDERRVATSKKGADRRCGHP